MNNDKFLELLSTVANWKYDEQTGGPVITEIKTTTADCSKCWTERDKCKLTSRWNNNKWQANHWRTKCDTVNKWRNPDNDTFTMELAESQIAHNRFYRKYSQQE